MFAFVLVYCCGFGIVYGFGLLGHLFDCCFAALFVLVGLAVVGLVCLGELVVGVVGGCYVSLWFMVRSL